MTISFGYTVMPAAPPKKKQRSLLPLLTVLFLFSYGLMTMLIVEQGSAIQSQHDLIKVLLRDSVELWRAKGKAIGDQQMAQAQAGEKNPANSPSTQAQTPSSRIPFTQTPLTQAPSTETPSTQAPSTQVPSAKQHHSPSRAGRFAKPDTQVPPAPASDLVDRRRALTTI